MTPKTTSLDMVRSQSAIVLRRKPASSEWKITNERVDQLAWPIVEHVVVAKLGGLVIPATWMRKDHAPL